MLNVLGVIANYDNHQNPEGLQYQMLFLVYFRYCAFFYALTLVFLLIIWPHYLKSSIWSDIQGLSGENPKYKSILIQNLEHDCLKINIEINKVLLNTQNLIKKTPTTSNLFKVPCLRENVKAPPSHWCKKTWPKVPGRVNGVARVEAHGQSNDQNHKAHSEGLQSLGDGVVVGIHDSQNANNKRRCANDLRSKANQSKTVNATLYICKGFLNDGNYLVKEAV